MEELEPITLSSAERASLSAHAASRAEFDILGARIRIAGNDPAILDLFRALYDRFEVAVSDRPDMVLEYDLSADGALTIAAPPEFYRVTYPEIIRWPSSLFGRIILGRLRTRYLIHAGCIARDGRALILAGGSGMGKSTLSAHLAARGFDFLSDELAPISRKDGFVEPFPLRIGVRAGPGRDLLREGDGIEMSFRSDHKKLVDVETFAGRPPGARARLHAVIFLTTDLSQRVITPQKRDPRLRAWFLNWSPALAAALDAELDARALDSEEEDGMTRVELRIENLPAKVERMRDLARRHRAVLAMIQYDDLERVDRSAESELLPIPVTAGVVELIKKMPAYQRVGFMESDFGGKSSGLVLDLARLVQDVKFFKMQPGRLDSSIAHVERIVG